MLLSGNSVAPMQPMMKRWTTTHDSPLTCTRERLKFEPHYHPYVSTFISELNTGGIPALLIPENQKLANDPDFFDDTYDPKEIVMDPYPQETVDFEPSGAYSLYNWELFFHIPLLIATRLMQDQRFEEARKWFHYIFNPTDSSPVDPKNPTKRYWKVLKFQETEPERLADFLRTLSAKDNDPETEEKKRGILALIADWREEPFKPHRLAQFRLAAYQKSVVMKYIRLVP